MGASNVAKVFAYWTHLDHREVRGLAFMANLTMDQDSPPVYFAGWEALATALGHDPEGSPENAKRTAMRVLSALRKEGAIVSSGVARMKVRAEYALSLDPSKTFLPEGAGRNVVWREVIRQHMRVTATDTQQGDSYRHPPKTLNVTQVGDSYGLDRVTAMDTPRKEPQEQQEEYREDKTIGDVVNSPARTRSADELDYFFPQPDAERLQARADAIKADTTASIDAERVRQSQALIRMQAEFERNLATEGTQW